MWSFPPNQPIYPPLAYPDLMVHVAASVLFLKKMKETQIMFIKVVTFSVDESPY